jgi:Tfp pilus assembly pilus retraction ATPase PilT
MHKRLVSAFHKQTAEARLLRKRKKKIVPISRLKVKRVFGYTVEDKNGVVWKTTGQVNEYGHYLMTPVLK